MKVKNKTILITGAGSGIGRELSLQLLQMNANIIGIDIHENTLNETKKLAEAAGERFHGIVLDISDKNEVDALPRKVIDHFGQIDGIINNAGIIQKFIPVNDLDIKDIYRVMNINFYGTVFMTKAFLPYLLQRPEAHIINISSMGGFIPFPGQTIYGASKAAVKLFSEGLYAELKNTTVKVTVIHPGAIATNITANSGLEPVQSETNTNAASKTLPASIAAQKIIQAIEQNKYRATIGRDAAMLDLFYRISPGRATHFIGKMMGKYLNK